MCRCPSQKLSSAHSKTACAQPWFSYVQFLIWIGSLRYIVAKGSTVVKRERERRGGERELCWG